MNHSSSARLATLCLSLITFSTLGCGPSGPKLVPASGVVLYEGKPLDSGSVMFQPAKGPASRAKIQSDGTFVMSTRSEGDGATIGPQAVRVSKREKSSVSNGGETVLGKSMIPEAYSNFKTSGITVDIPAEGDDSIVIELGKK